MVVFFVEAALFQVFLAADDAVPDPLLQHRQAWVVHAPDGRTERVDPSGLARWNGSLTIISDKAAFPDLYAISPGTDTSVPMTAVGTAPPREAGTDTEGLAVCGEALLIVVERENQLVRMHQTGPATVTHLDLDAIDSTVPPQHTWLNAGLEGVACAPDGRVWVAKEREPRAIFQIDPTTGAAVSVWDAWSRSDTVQQADRTRFWPSWSDLQFTDGSLYALHRDGRRIVRLDPTTGKETGAVRLALDEASLYNDTKPYGMAEGMLIEEGRIWVILDNNTNTMKAGPRAQEPAPMLFVYDRPDGF